MPESLILEKTLGAAFFTFVIGSILYGITLSQVYRYYKTYPDDTRYLKSTVAFICLLDTLHSAFSIHMMWYWLVKQAGENIGLAQVTWNIKAVAYIHVLTMLFVQGIYLSRIYIFSQKSIDVGYICGIAVRLFCVLGGILALSAVIVFLVEVQKIHFLLEFGTGAKWILYYAFGVTMVVDMGITAGMSLVLHKSRVRMKGIQLASNVVVTKIIVFFISSGLLTTLIAIIYMALYSALPDVLLFVGATFSTSKLYANSVLAMINARRHLRSQLAQTRDLEMISSIQFQTANTLEGKSTSSSLPKKHHIIVEMSGKLNSISKRIRRGSV